MANEADIHPPLDQHPRPQGVAQEKSGPPVRSASASPMPAMPVHDPCTKTTITHKGNNGDEDELKGPDGHNSYIGNYHKGMHHNEFGEVKPADYQAFLHAMKAGKDCDKIPLAGKRLLTNPQAGFATDVEGPDPADLKILAPPKLASAEEAAEGVELYWMALLRDVAFNDFDHDPGVAAAATELSGLADFTGPKAGGKVTPQTIFRGCEQGDLVGPLVSQFLLQPFAYGALQVEQKMKTVLGEAALGAGKADYVTHFDEWLKIQNGEAPAILDRYDPTRRFIRNMRDIGEYVHVDALYEAYLNACLILLDNSHMGFPFDSGNPYNPPLKDHPDKVNQMGFATFGGPHVLSLVTEVATRALKAVWYQKWAVNRRLRPEAYGGLIEVKLAGVGGHKRDYPIHDQILHSEALKRTHAKFGSYLLPMAFPEGSPLHPSYGAGHATVAGACVTILKAFFQEDLPLPFKPVVPNADGTDLVPYTGADAGQLTVLGELNKVAANIAIARNMAGVHWRSDYTQSVRLGEQVALCILKKQSHDYNEKDWSFTVKTFDNQTVTISEGKVVGEDGNEIHLHCG